MHSHRRLAGLAAAAVTLVALACAAGTDDAASAWSGDIDELGELALVEERRIGSVSDPEQGFSSLTSVDVDADGMVYAMDGRERVIRVVSPEGRIVGDIGGPGEGPGEFQTGPLFGVRGDTVWTVEVFSRRLTLFARSGEVLKASSVDPFRVPLPSAYGILTPWQMRPDGTFLGWFGLITGARGEDPGVDESDDLSWPLVRFDTEGDVIDTLGWAPKPPPRMWRPSSDAANERRIVEIGGGRHVVPSPPTGLADWETAPESYVTVESPPPTAARGSIVVSRIGLAGDTLYRRVLLYAPEAWTGLELDSIANRAARGEPGGFAPYRPGAQPPDDWRAIAARLRQEMSFPPYKLPLACTWVSRDGHVVLALRPGEGAAERSFVLIGPDGTPVGRLTLPLASRPLWTDGGTLWVSETDDLGVPWLVRNRIGTSPS